MNNINNKPQIQTITEDKSEGIILQKAYSDNKENLEDSRILTIENLKSAFINKADEGRAFQGSLGLIPSIYGHGNTETERSIVENFADLETQDNFESFIHHSSEIVPNENRADISLTKQTRDLHELICYRKRKRSVPSSASDTKINELCTKEARDFFAKYIDNKVFSNDSEVREIDAIGTLGCKEKNKVQYASLSNGNILNALLELQGSFAHDLINNSIWLTSPRVWFAIRAIKDVNGNFIITDDKFLFNTQVVIHPGFDNTLATIMLVNLKNGLKVIRTNVEYHEQDDTDAGSKLDCLRKGVSVYVKNEKAFTSLVIENLPEEGIDFNATKA